MLNRWLCLLTLMIPVGLQAAEQAGKVVLSVGKNTAQLDAQPPRALKRNGPVYVRDQISTGERGQLQLRLSDGSRVSLENNTLFTLEQHRYPEDSPQQGRAVYQLIKGGLRTITGAISAAEPDNYALKTPIATIGVRGTHYSLFFCDQSCSESSGRPRGLWGQVLEGTIVVKVAEHQSDVPAGKHFFLEAGQRQPLIQSESFTAEQLQSRTAVLDTVPDAALPDLDRQPLSLEQEVQRITIDPDLKMDRVPAQTSPLDASPNNY
ncbi:FecR family protein [Neptuniibacter halophilus]|uniref:FecR family protein n=1 Tax=Neptuniibacter halophilus TaxID=651666 RepID=UPI00257365F3|nr:FecR family protein [Neptuniibacter halophilus]